jgi:hypothetical protein
MKSKWAAEFGTIIMMTIIIMIIMGSELPCQVWHAYLNIQPDDYRYRRCVFDALIALYQSPFLYMPGGQPNWPSSNPRVGGPPRGDELTP